MLPQVNRLRAPKDFKAVYTRGLHRKTAHLTLRALKRLVPPEIDAGDPPSRFGISISQKVSKRAVRRNLLKRQIRAGLRELLSKISPGWDVVIVVKPTAIECNYAEILRELEKLLVQAEVLHGHSGGELL
ncbi:MAG: ribonuclease P protein component [Arthrospira sp. PLM2.Bin9]|nr:ribonuclease P protein component [Arthrospira sp. PLM2.Bin9]TVU54321.1 MAG: ribonuclease P protein component [Arthrospira sp. PLM2.Bin9]